MSDTAEKGLWREPPEGWFTFGTHVDQPVRLEFSDEVGEDLLPLWERPIPPAEKCGVCGATRDEPEKCGYPGGCPIPPGEGDTDG